MLQVSERFAAVDMDLSEDSVDLEEAVMNGIHLLNVCICVYVCVSVLCMHVCLSFLMMVYVQWCVHLHVSYVVSLHVVVVFICT